MHDAATGRRQGGTLTGLGFPEALRWHEGALWLSDMFRGRVVRWPPESSAAPDVVLDTASGGPAIPGGLGWLPDGRLLVVDCTQRLVLRLDADRTISVHADLSSVFTHPANDMHVDADGTAWVGSYGFEPGVDEPASSPLARVAPDGTVTLTSAQFVFPNGCERDAAGNLVVAETFADRVSVLDDTGTVTTLASFEPGSGPDGLSIAADGTVYVALAFAGAIAAIDPNGQTPAVRIVARSRPIGDGPGAGPTGIYDCAVHPERNAIAFATASLDEPLAERVDTGSVHLVPLPRQES